MLILRAAIVAGAEPPAPLLDDVAVRLEPCVPFPYVEPEAKGKVSFLFTSKADHELQLTWKVQIGLPVGNGPELEEKLILPPGGNKRLAMPDLVTAHRGVVRFTWTLTDQNGRRLALQDTLGVMTLPGPESAHRSSFRFGWGTSLVHFVAAKGEEKCMATYAQMGIDLIRVGDMWAYSENGGNAAEANRNKGYLKDAEPIINEANAAGIDVLYVMWGAPKNLARAGFSNEAKIEEMATDTKTPLDLMLRVRPPDPAAWRVRVKDTVSKFNDRVKYWEIWNDEDRYHDNGHHMPNGWVGNTDEYLELLRDASAIIKSVDSKLTVLNGGFFTVGKDSKHDLNPNMQQRVVREAQTSFDVFACFDANPALMLGPLAELRNEFKAPKPLWLTRVEQRGSTPDELVRRLLSAKGCGASAFVWMWAQNFDSGFRGLLTLMSSWKSKDRKTLNQHSVFQMQPAGCAYIHAIGLLRMLPKNTRLDSSVPGQWLFAFADASGNDRRQVVGLWHDDKLSDATVRMSVGAKATCSLIDLYGNAEPVLVRADGTVTVSIKRIPAYVVVTDGDSVKTIRD